MPVVDMALADLRTYKGTNPKPADFDEFWKKRMEEVAQVPLTFELQEADVNLFDSCEFYDVYFKGIHGERLYAKYVKPKGISKCPLVLQFHGYPGASRPWIEQASFCALGYAIIAMDLAGQGGKSEDGGMYRGTSVAGHIVAGLDGDPKDMYYVRAYQNIGVLYRIVQTFEGIDTNQLYANGASQGGGLALVCAALHPGIKKASILYPFLSDFQRVWDMDLDVIAYEGLRYYSRWFDPMQEKEGEMFEKLGYIDVHNFAPYVKAEVMFGTGLIDTICPPSTQFAVYNNLKCKKKHYLFPDFAHEEIGAFDDLIIDFLAQEV